MMKCKGRILFASALACLPALSAPSTDVRQEDDLLDVGNARTLYVPHTSEPPVIDGRLDDPGWRSAAVAHDFWMSLEGSAPTDQTEVFVLRDEEYLYFGFRCYDSQPDTVHAIRTQRDAGLAADDLVSVQLDSFLNYRTISTYSVNAIGTQNDAIAGGRARKIEWKGDWKAGAMRTAYGWSAEIAIPYSILNYHRDAGEFGINFRRYQYRTDQTSYWADLTPQFKNERMGRITGLVLPEVDNEHPWTVMPYVLASSNTSNIEGDPRDEQIYAGAEIRYEPRPNVTNVLSLHPDFSTLETQVTDIDFSYNEKFRSDPRPFFQEGSAYFGDDIQYFYSNRVADFYAGAKSFAQFGRNGIGGFVTYAPDERWDGVARFQHDFDATHSADVMAVATHREDLRNQLLVARTNGRQQSGWYYNADVAWSNTEGRTFDQGGAGGGALGWRGNYWDFGVSGDYFDKSYFPANGLLDDNLYGTRSRSYSGSYYRRFTASNLREVGGDLIWFERDTTSGLKQNYGIYAGANVELERQIRISGSYFDADYRPATERGEFADSLNHDRFWDTSIDFNTRSTTYGYGVYYAEGRLGGGDYEYVSGYGWLRPTTTSIINVASERLDNFGIFKQTIVSGSWDITPQSSVVARYIVADGPDYKRIAFRRTVRNGMDLFVVYNKEPFSDEELSIKLLWVLRL